jgi:hypothetical protein
LACKKKANKTLVPTSLRRIWTALKLNFPNQLVM